MSRLHRGLLAAALLLFVTACGNDEGFQNPEIPSGFLRIVNAVSDSPQLNISVNERAVESVSFPGSSQFSEVLPELSLRFTAQYVANEQVNSLFSNEPVFVNVDHDHTVVLTGTIANPRLIQIDNPPLSETATDGELELQFMHAAPGLDQSVEVTLTSGGDVVQSEMLNFADVSSRLKVPAGTYEIEVRDSDTDLLLWESGEFNVNSQTRGLIVLIDYFGPSGPSANGVRMIIAGEGIAISFNEEVLPASIRYANMTPDQGPLDIYFNDTLVQGALAFVDVTEYSDIAVGSVDVKVTPAGEPATVISEAESLNIGAGSFHTLALAGLGDTNNVQLFVDDRRRISVRGFLSFTNTAPSFSVVDVYVMDPGTSVDDRNPTIGTLTQLGNASSTRRVALDAGSYDVVVTDGGTKTVVLGPQRIDVEVGGLYSVFLTDTAGGGEPLEFVFGDDFE